MLDDFNFDADCQFDTYLGLAGPFPAPTSSESPLTDPPPTTSCPCALPQIPEPTDTVGCDFPDLWSTTDHVYTDRSIGSEFAPVWSPWNGHSAEFSHGSGPKISAESSRHAQVPLIPSSTYQDKHRMLRRTCSHRQPAQHPTHSTTLLSPNCNPWLQRTATVSDSHLWAGDYQPDDEERIPEPHILKHSSIPSAHPPPILGVLTSDPVQANSPDVKITDSEAKKLRRQRNSAAARKYRQRRVDRIEELEQALKKTQTERDELKVQVARWRGKAEALQALMANSRTGDVKD